MKYSRQALSLTLLFAAACTDSSDRKLAATGGVVASSSPGVTFRDCAECPEMVVLPAGDFTMGSPADEPGYFEVEGPQRQVHVARVAVGKYHVTRGQWAAFVSATNRETIGGCAWSGLPSSREDQPDPAATWRDFGFPQDDSHPAACLTFGDAQDYARWLTDRTGHHYRLLSEAEWEYAARAGSTTAFPWGATASHEFANYGADECCAALASGRDQWANSSPVGSFPPNAFGLYDMNGDIMQWVEDCFAASYAGLPTDGSAYVDDHPLNLSGEMAVLNGTSSCSYRMLRGGDWNNPPEMIRSAARNFGPPPGATLADYKSAGTGLRVARALE